MTELPIPAPGRDEAEAFVADHLSHLVCDQVAASPCIRGGQAAADTALAAFDVAGYAASRNEVHPPSRRGASRLSPYIRHGLLTLGEVWNHVAAGPKKDVQKFRDELMWQEFARHWYARLGTATRNGVRNRLGPRTTEGSWDRNMACIAVNLEELERDGWLVNQSRMWLSSHWGVRRGHDWRNGEDYFFRHLLDGSRAANRLGWQWTTGTGSSKHYGFSRRQVETRAPGLCALCPHTACCPIDSWPSPPNLVAVEGPVQLRTTADAEAAYGPRTTHRSGHADAVWLTGESLGIDDPALAANGELPAVFVFDEPLLNKLRLSSKRLVFLTETLAQIATGRELSIRLGDPVVEVAGRNLAVTFAPVPGFRRLADRLRPVELHPWTWLVEPSTGSVASFSAWRKASNVVLTG